MGSQLIVNGSLSLTVLGCSGSYPGPGGACSGYLVQGGATSVWLDCGSGTLANLQRHIPLEALDAVVVSHEHVDHWTDLEHLAVAYRWVLDRSGVPVFAQESLKGLLRVGPAADVFDWHPIGDGSSVVVGALDFRFSQTDHSVPTLASRIDCFGQTLAYSADTGPGWGFEELGEGIDLALCEATYLSDQEGNLPHLSARQAGDAARRAGVGRLVITHQWSTIDPDEARREAAAAFGGPVEVARNGERYQV